MSARLYVVTDATSNTKHLIKAATQAQAVRHVAAARLSCSVASGLEVADLMSAGVVPEDAKASPAETEPQ